MSPPASPASPFRHCSHCGSSQLAPRSAREFVCTPCGFRHFITAIPAACALLLDSQGRLLVTRRGHQPGLGKLGLPGGVIEGGETGESAASREVEEEVGLKVPASAFRYFMSLPNEYLFQEFVWPTLDLFYVAQIESFDAVLIDTAEVSEWMPLPLNAIPLAEFAFSSNAEAIRQLRLTHP